MSPRYHKEVGSLECTGSRPGGEGGSKRPCDLRLEYAITAFPDEVS
jgi:hypothetical protein